MIYLKLEDMEPNYIASIEFLGKFAPDGPWALSAIHPDKKVFRADTFFPDTTEAAAAWLEEYGAERNIYFHVNPVINAIKSKAQREDIKEMAWLHVDVDPRGGEDLLKEQERALSLLRQPPGDIPAPTCIIFSGGGYQAFWRLEDPVEINGQADKYEQAKRYNKYLEQELGGDKCHNVDRIMRLPGTINRPDENKRKRGRKEALAKVIYFNDVIYDIKTFNMAAEVDDGSTGFTDSRKVHISGNIKRIEDIDLELPECLSKRIKRIIATGQDHEDPDRYASKSEALFAAVCGLVVAKVPDDTIYSIITDPDWGISAHVLAQKNPDRCAKRQILRAREAVVHPELVRMNEKYAVVTISGKCMVVYEQYDYSLDRPELVFQAFADFKKQHDNETVDIKIKNKDGEIETIKKKKGSWWLDQPARRQYNNIEFIPNKDLEEKGIYNMWYGFKYEPKKGDCEKFLQHVQHNICNNDEKCFNYLMGWLATAVQIPEQQGHTAVVMRGRAGAGKGVFASSIGKLFGRHFLQVTNPKHLIGNFNSHLRSCVFLFADEAFYAGDVKNESILKTLVTEDKLAIEAKGIDVIVCRSCLHVIMASNNNWVVPAGLDDRRFFVLDVADTKMQDSAYFKDIIAELESGGYEALLHHLMHYDLSEYNVRDIPKTKALQEQKLYSMTTEEEWWYNKLQDGRLLDGDAEWRTMVLKNHMLLSYTGYMRTFSSSNRRSTATRLGQFLQKALPGEFPKNKQGGGAVEVMPLDGGPPKIQERPRYYLIPDLKTCREHWDTHFGGPHNWDIVEDIVDAPTQVNEEIPF